MKLNSLFIGKRVKFHHKNSLSLVNVNRNEGYFVIYRKLYHDSTIIPNVHNMTVCRPFVSFIHYGHHTFTSWLEIACIQSFSKKEKFEYT